MSRAHRSLSPVRRGTGRADRPQTRVVPRALDRDVGVLAAFEREPEREQLQPDGKRDLLER